jgi:hypothetical protein
MRTHTTVVPTIRRLIVAHFVVALSCWGITAFAQEQSSPQSRDSAADANRPEARSAQPDAAKGETGRSLASGETRDDLALVQGTWERLVKGKAEGPVARVVKEIKGNKETVTYYDDAGKVTRQHRVDFVLDSAGPVKIFTFSNQEILEGPDKGRRYPGTVSYVYRVGPREFAEVWGFLPGQESRTTLLLVWRRVKEGSESDRQPPAAGERREATAQGAASQQGQAQPAAQRESASDRNQERDR